MAYTLTIDGVSLNVPGAWHVNRSLIRLMGGPKTRGENTRIPNVPGVVPNPQRIDETIYDLELVVRGKNNASLTPWSDEIVGKFENLGYLQNALAIPDGSTYKAASLLLPTGDTQFADVQVLNWQVAADHGVTAIVTFDLLVLDGAFAVGS